MFILDLIFFLKTIQYFKKYINIFRYIVLLSILKVTWYY